MYRGCGGYFACKRDEGAEAVQAYDLLIQAHLLTALERRAFLFEVYLVSYSVKSRLDDALC